RLFDSFCFFQAYDGIRARNVTGVQTCARPISTPPPVGFFTEVEASAASAPGSLMAADMCSFAVFVSMPVGTCGREDAPDRDGPSLMRTRHEVQADRAAHLHLVRVLTCSAVPVGTGTRGRGCHRLPCRHCLRSRSGYPAAGAGSAAHPPAAPGSSAALPPACPHRR